MQQNHLMFWGSNQNNLLPTNSSLKNYNVPQSCCVPYNIMNISASQKHISFITNNGQLYSYGSNLDGRLGIGSSNIKHTINNPVKISLPNLVRKVQCGFSHVCIILDNWMVLSWGLGDYGALGTGQFKSYSIPHKVSLQIKIKEISCGAMHTAFIDFNYNVYMCGSNQYGQLGLNKPDKICTPCMINLNNNKIKLVSCGVFYTLLLTISGKIYGMGNNKYGQLGIGHKINQCYPTQIKNLNNISYISAGYHSGAIDSNGYLYIWGSGSFGQLLKPKKYIINTFFKQIYIRGFFGIALSENKMYIWGNNTYGQLGNGKYQAVKQPIQVQSLTGAIIKSIACGVNFIIAVVAHYPIISTYRDNQLELQIEHRKNINLEHRKLYIEHQNYHGNRNRNYQNQIYHQRSPYQENHFVQNQKISQRIPYIQKSKIQRSPYVEKVPYEKIYAQKIPYMERSPYAQKTYAQRATPYMERNSYIEKTSNEKVPYIQRTPYQNVSYSRTPYEHSQIQNNCYNQPVFEQNQTRKQHDYLHKSNYQQLFNNLSSEYEQLLLKYTHLQEQLKQKISNKDQIVISQRKNHEIMHEMDILKQQLSQLMNQKIQLRQQLNTIRDKNRMIQQQSIKNAIQNTMNNSPNRMNNNNSNKNNNNSPNKNNNYNANKNNNNIPNKNNNNSLYKNNNNSPNKNNNNSPNKMSSNSRINQNKFQLQLIEQKYKKLLDQKNKQILEIFTNFKKIQSNLYQKINQLIKEKQIQNQEIKKHIENSKITNNLSNRHQQLQGIINQQQIKIEELNNNMEKQMNNSINLYKQEEMNHLEIKKLCQEKKDMLKYIEELKIKQQTQIPLLRHKLQDLSMKQSISGEKINQIEIELNCQKQFTHKCQQSLRNMTDLKDKIYKQFDCVKKQLQNQRLKGEQLKIQVDKVIILKKTIDTMNIKIEQQRQDNEKYQQRMKQMMNEKQQIIKKMQLIMEDKQRQVQNNIKIKKQEINQLKNDVRQFQNLYSISKQQNIEYKKQIGLITEQRDKLHDRQGKLERKINIINQENIIEIKQKEEIGEKLSQVKRQNTKIKLEKDQLYRNIQILENEKLIGQNKNKDKQQVIAKMEDVQRENVDKIQNLKKEAMFVKEQFANAKLMVQQSNCINQQLSKANREFADNEQKLTSKINQLQNRLYEVEDENKSYTPRYEALLQRNNQLDNRNRQLSQMINKAIEIQAESYKNNILKEVEINTEEIIEQVKQQQSYKQKNRRKNKIKQNEEESHHEEYHSSNEREKQQKEEEEPYTKMVNNRMSVHKRKINQSAKKLADILQMEDKSISDKYECNKYTTQQKKIGITSKYNVDNNNKNTEDLEKINYQMQSLQEQKQQFMSKINSFAQKLKIL